MTLDSKIQWNWHLLFKIIVLGLFWFYEVFENKKSTKIQYYEHYELSIFLILIINCSYFIHFQTNVNELLKLVTLCLCLFIIACSASTLSVCLSSEGNCSVVVSLQKSERFICKITQPLEISLKERLLVEMFDVNVLSNRFYEFLWV